MFIKLIKTIFGASSPSIIKMLKSIYYGLFDRKMHDSFRNYNFTDEKLKFTHILEAINYLRVAELPPVYFEFGCHSARTFSAAVSAAKFLKIDDAKFFAFDSFEGLPETVKEDDGYFESGTFSTPVNDFIRLVKRRSGLELSKENIIKGFYEDSLTLDVQSRMPKVGVVHIDVDLYSSTVEVLNFIKPLLVVGSVLVFDDWYCFAPGSNMGERRALEEFCHNNQSFKVEEWKSYSTFGKSFFVTAIS